MKKLLLLVFLFPLVTVAQSKKQKKAIQAQQKADQVLLESLKTHVQYLADDKLEGRRAGTPGEALAKEYISNAFSTIGLEPKGNNSFLQNFDIDEGRHADATTRFVLNDQPLRLKEDYFPLSYSANKTASGSPALSLREAGEPWFADVKEWVEANQNNQSFNINELIRKESDRVAAKGAIALILFNSSSIADNIIFNPRDSGAQTKIPVVYLTKQAVQKYCSDRSAILDVELNVAVKERKRTASNVIGYIDNGAAATVVFGAHYDHLGYGEDGNSMDTGYVIRNGADDNASGTAALIELARLLKNDPNRQNNYLFIAFSAEEMGLYGSKFWLNNRTISTPINYMINLDMVGRYDITRKLTIGGIGTSPVWSTVLSTLSNPAIMYRIDSSGNGPSDHAAFYNKDIPVLFFFTGIHSDYHRATDDWDKLNFEGQLQIVRFIHKVVQATNTQGKLAFTKTIDPSASQAVARFNVSLGVIPDYTFSGQGLRIDGVSPKKLAEKIGLQAGDVLLQLGEHQITEINSYMMALSRFKKGDQTALKIVRGKDEKLIAVEF